MRRAVLLTGALRTIRKTMKFFLRNVLCPARDGEGWVSVFACVQNDTSESEETWTAWLREQIGAPLVDVVWFSVDRFPGWKEQRELLLSHMTISETWKDYLRSSGSMIEYYQLQLAYLKMCHMEALGGFRFDYVIRARTDSVYAQPLDFAWRGWSVTDVEARMTAIRGVMGDVDARTMLTYIMASLWSSKVVENLPFVEVSWTQSPLGLGSVPSTAEDVLAYLREGRYIQTIRKNNLYVARREFFYLIPMLGTLYGTMRSPVADDYWFNAEGQFRDACYYSCLDVHDYSSAFEERSLAYPSQWNEADFFDGEGEMIHPRMVYCVVRR